MPALLDQLLRTDYFMKEVENESRPKPEANQQKKKLEEKLVGLGNDDVEFLMLGLAYHIPRQQDSVRLSTKTKVKNHRKAKKSKEDDKDSEGDSDERKEEGEDDSKEEEEEKSTEKGAGSEGAAPLKLGLRCSGRLDRPSRRREAAWACLRRVRGGAAYPSSSGCP